jgi:hypothetical protein
MRYQELIYIQNENSAVRNKDILNVNTSSDICIFEAPSFYVSGASKINCSGSTGTTYVITTATTIPISFNFTGNTNSFTANTASFKYEIYKYREGADSFVLPPVYRSNTINYSSFSGTNIVSENVPINNLLLDGEYLVKGYFNFSPCTEYGSLLDKKYDTISYRSGTEYGLYNDDLDYYFIAFKAADTPRLLSNGSNTPPSNQLFQQVILPEAGQTNITITQAYAGFFVVTLNGLVLSPNLDYTYTGNVITLSATTEKDDIVTIIYTTTGGNNLIGDNIIIGSAIVSGTTNNEGSNSAYFNTTTQKYEIYTNITPSTGGSILVMINGVTLANGIDYYQSTSNPKRLILEGDLMSGDLITIVYFPSTTVVNGIIVKNPLVSWQIDNAPQTTGGTFTLQTSTNSSFSSISFSTQQNYVIGKTLYYETLSVTGTVGTKLYYRVKNEKKYTTICGDLLVDTAYSEAVPITIQTNSINSY